MTSWSALSSESFENVCKAVVASAQIADLDIARSQKPHEPAFVACIAGAQLLQVRLGASVSPFSFQLEQFAIVTKLSNVPCGPDCASDVDRSWCLNFLPFQCVDTLTRQPLLLRSPTVTPMVTRDTKVICCPSRS